MSPERGREGRFQCDNRPSDVVTRVKRRIKGSLKVRSANTGRGSLSTVMRRSSALRNYHPDRVASTRVSCLKMLPYRPESIRPTDARNSSPQPRYPSHLELHPPSRAKSELILARALRRTGEEPAKGRRVAVGGISGSHVDAPLPGVVRFEPGFHSRTQLP
jgi:hypothetical protein